MTSFLMGGRSKTTTPIYTGLQVQTSAYDLPIPIGWGKNRLSFNVIWYNDFKKHKANQGGKGGGKGAGGYTYSAAVLLALGEGVISSIPNVFMNQNTVTTLAKTGLTLFTGTAVQSPFSYISTAHPSEALSYANTAYLASSNLDLGSAATVPSMAFECVMNLSGTMPGTDDVNLADVAPDFLTNVRYGMGLTSGEIDSASLAQFKSYTQAQGLFFSPTLVSPERAGDIIDRWAKLSNSWIFWSGDVIKFVPLGDEALSAHSATYTPANSVIYDLTVDDMVAVGNPVKVSRVDPADAYNRTILNISDRALQYNSNPIEYKDQTLVDRFGLRDNSNGQASEICDAAVGKIAATLIGKRAANLRNTYSFTLNDRFVLLEPGDIVTITHPFVKAITKLPVRIVSIEEDEKGDLATVAEEYPGTIGVFRSSSTETPSSNPVDQLVDPGNVNDPCIFEPNASLASPAQIWLSASGGANWGGADVYVSFDGSLYSKVGTINAAAKQGVLTGNLASHADPDTTNTLHVDLTESQGVLEPVTHTDADASRTLSYLAAPSSAGVVPTTGELIAYGTVSSTGTYTDDLTYLRRGRYGTSPGSHTTGDNFTLLDLTDAAGSLVKYQLPSQYIGATIHVKFVSFNIFGLEYQDISTVTDYTYTPSGTGFGGGTAGVPTTPTGLTATPGVGGNLLTWTANPVTDNVTNYKIYRASGTGASFGSAALIATLGVSTNWTDTGITVGSGYTYFVVAHNAVGDSAPSTGANCTSASTVQNYLRISFGTPGRKPNASEEISNPPMFANDKLKAADAANWLCRLETAATSSFTVTFYKNGVSIGSVNVSASGTTGTFTWPSDVTFSAGDLFTAVCPASQDATASGLGISMFGTRA